MYTFNNDVKYQGKYLSITDDATNEKDIVFKIQDLMHTVKDSNHPQKVEIFAYLNKDNVYFCLKKKFIKTDFEKLKTAVKMNKSNIIDDMNADFKNIFNVATTKISEEPLILEFPFIENAPQNSYFIKTKKHIGYNKSHMQKQLSIALERFHRISRSIQDEYIIFYVQQLFSCPQLEKFLNTYNYTLNYNLIYKNLENLDPYAFENMEKELMRKLTECEIKENPNYSPSNLCFTVLENEQTPLNEEEFNQKTTNVKNRIANKLEETTYNSFNPFYNKKIAKVALTDLFNFLDTPKTKRLMKSGELYLNDGFIIASFGYGDKFDYYFISSAINAKFCIDELNAYYDYIKIDNLSMNLE